MTRQRLSAMGAWTATNPAERRYHTGMDRAASVVFRKIADSRHGSGDERQDFPIADADQCVKCALCLPHCPTYRETLDENESPRGRIALMQGLARGELPASGRAAAHLERCLGCRNCEPVCPAEVPYGRLIDAGRRIVRESGHRSRREQLAARVLGSSLLLRLSIACLRLYQLTGLQRLARLSLLRILPGLARLDALLPERIPTRRKRSGEAADTATVQVFLGCLGETLDPGVTDALERLLRACGHRPRFPAGQGCCAAPKQHGGDAAGAMELARDNIAAFRGDNPILGSASGCTASLMEYPEILSKEEAQTFAERVQDACTFLDRAMRDTPGPEFSPLNARVLLHTPCSQRNVVGDTEAAARLVEQVPGIKLHRLDSRGDCCGAAGTYTLGQPAMSRRLARTLADRIREEQPDFVLTTNIGCKLQLRAALAGTLPDCEILHPLELLDRQMRSRSPDS